MEGMSFKGLIDTWSWTLIAFVGARVLFVFVMTLALFLKKLEKQKWLRTNMQASRFGKVWAHKQTSVSPAGWFTPTPKWKEEQRSYGLTACLMQRKFTACFCWQPVLPLSRGRAVMVPISRWAALLPVVILFSTAQQKQGLGGDHSTQWPSTPTVPPKVQL